MEDDSTIGHKTSNPPYILSALATSMVNAQLSRLLVVARINIIATEEIPKTALPINDLIGSRLIGFSRGPSFVKREFDPGRSLAGDVASEPCAPSIARNVRSS